MRPSAATRRSGTLAVHLARISLRANRTLISGRRRRDKAKAAYQDFLTLWQEVDPDIPIYKQANAEYAKLQ